MLTRMPKIGDIVVLRKTNFQDAARGRVTEVRIDGIVVLETIDGGKRASFLAMYISGALSRHATIEE